MIKYIGIDWSKAPEWANYAAQDSTGEWYWYEFVPWIDGDEASTWSDTEGKWERMEPANWKESLRKRQ